MNDITKGSGRDLANDGEESWLARVAKWRLEGITLIAIENAGIANIDTGFTKKNNVTPATSTDLVAPGTQLSASPIFANYMGVINEELAILKPYLANPGYKLSAADVEIAAQDVFEAAVSNAMLYLQDPAAHGSEISRALSHAAAGAGIRRSGGNNGGNNGGGAGGSRRIL